METKKSDVVTNCIIICAGEATRWNNYLGVPKHLIKIGGETLIERAVKLIHKYKTEEVKISIVVKDIDDKRYFVEGAETVEANLHPENLDSDKFFSSQHLWNKSGRTLVIYGDVWFSDEAMKTIMEYKDEEWILFASVGECFVQSFYPKDLDKHLTALITARDAHLNGETIRCGGWEHYRAICGHPLTKHLIQGNFYEIKDLTDDFDYGSEYDKFMLRYYKIFGEKPN